MSDDNQSEFEYYEDGPDPEAGEETGIQEESWKPTPGEQALLRWYLDEIGTITIGRGKDYFNERLMKYKQWHKAQRDDPSSPARFKPKWTARHMIQQVINTGQRMRKQYEDEYGPTQWPKLPE